MSLLTILEFPDPRLRKKASPVTVVDDALRNTIDDMFETMYNAPGIGLAATQVDLHKRLLVLDVSIFSLPKRTAFFPLNTLLPALP